MDDVLRLQPVNSSTLLGQFLGEAADVYATVRTADAQADLARARANQAAEQQAVPMQSQPNATPSPVVDLWQPNREIAGGITQGQIVIGLGLMLAGLIAYRVTQ